MASSFDDAQESVSMADVDEPDIFLQHVEMVKSGDWPEKIFGRHLLCLTKFNLQAGNFIKIGASGCQIICAALETNDKVELWEHRRDKFGDKGGNAIGRLLQHNLVLEELRLHDVCAGSSGCQAICVALEQNSTLKSWKHECDDFGDGGAHALKNLLQRNTTLTCISLKSSLKTTQQCCAALEGLEQNSTLTSLDLSGCDLGVAGGKQAVSLLQRNTTLTELNLDRGGVPDDMKGQVDSLLRSNLENTLRKSTVYQSMLAALLSNDCYEEDDFFEKDGCDVDESPIIKLILHSSLRADDDDDYFEARCSMPFEGPISFSLADLGPSECKAICSALKNNSVVAKWCHERKIFSEGFGDVGTKALKGMIRHNTTLTHLSLALTTSQQCCAVLEALEQNASLEEVHLNDIIFDDFGAHVANALKHMLVRNSTLRSLSLLGTSDDWHQSGLTTSEQFYAVIESLEQNSSLTKLQLSLESLIPKFIFKQIQVLLFRNRQLSLQGWLSCPAFQNLITELEQKTDEISSIQQQDGEKWAYLELSSVECECRNVHDVCCPESFGLAVHQAICAALEQNSVVKSWKLTYFDEIGDEGGHAIARMLLRNSRLKRLYLQHNRIGSSGFQAIFAALEHNSTLVKLKIRNESHRLDFQTALAVQRMLQHNTTLKKLHLHDTACCPEFPSLILQGLELNLSLSSFKLTWVDTHVSFGEKIASLLQRNMLLSVNVSAFNQSWPVDLVMLILTLARRNKYLYRAISNLKYEIEKKQKLNAPLSQHILLEDKLAHDAACERHQQAGSVVIKRRIGAGFVTSDYIMQFRFFNSFVADVKLCGGCFYWEVEVVEFEVNGDAVRPIRFGVCTDEFSQKSSNEAGSHASSWAIDGVNMLKWHAGYKQAYGKVWSPGDVIGFALDMSKAGTACPDGSTLVDVPAAAEVTCSGEPTASSTTWQNVSGNRVAYRNSMSIEDICKAVNGPASGLNVVALEQRIGEHKNWIKVEVKDHGTKYLPIQKNGEKLFLCKKNGSVLNISINGTFDEAAFTTIDSPVLSPAFSGHGKFRVNFGDRPFIHAPPNSKYVSVYDAHASTIVQAVPVLEDGLPAASVRISGAIGHFADSINGFFAPTQEKSPDGRIVYSKRGDTSICIEHFNGQWQLKRLLHRRLNACYAYAPGGCPLETCTFNWKELDSNELNSDYDRRYFASFIRIVTGGNAEQEVGVTAYARTATLHLHIYAYFFCNTCHRFL
jgi:hypothetical protein